MQPNDVKRIVQQIDKLPDDPRPTGCRKIVSEKNRYRVRVGDFRVLYTIDENVKEIVIYRIAHRKEATKLDCQRKGNFDEQIPPKHVVIMTSIIAFSLVMHYVTSTLQF